MLLLQTVTLYIMSVPGRAPGTRDDAFANGCWGRMATLKLELGRRKAGSHIVQRVTMIIMVGIMITLVAVVFAVLGKGEYKPPAQDQGIVMQEVSV